MPAMVRGVARIVPIAVSGRFYVLHCICCSFDLIQHVVVRLLAVQISTLLTACVSIPIPVYSRNQHVLLIKKDRLNRCPAKSLGYNCRRSLLTLKLFRRLNPWLQDKCGRHEGKEELLGDQALWDPRDACGIVRK